MPRQCKGPPTKYSKPYDWPKIREDWLTSEHSTLRDFCVARRLNRESARRYLSVAEKKKLHTEAVRGERSKKKPNGDAPPAAAGIKDAQTGAEIVERRRVYVKAIEDSTDAVTMVMNRAIEEFDDMTSGDARMRWRSPSEAGSLAIRAAGERRDLAAELQGIPHEADEQAWDLTRRFWPLRYQRDFLFDTPSTMKAEGREGFVFAFVGGLGSGKTFCGAQKAGMTAWQNRGLPGAIYAPTYRMLEDPACAKHRFLEVIHEKGLSFRYHASQNKITLFGDTEVLFRSMDDPEHLRGPELAWVWLDEGLQMKTRAAFDVVIGRVRGRKGDPNTLEAKEPCVIFTGTANGLNWGYDLLVEDADVNQVQLYHGRTQDNTSIDPNYYRRLVRIYDERFAKQELEGEFIDVHRGRVYYAFARSEHLVAGKLLPKLLNPSKPLDLCVDFNVSPLCWNVLQDHPFKNETITYCLDEIHMDDANTAAAIKEFITRYGAHKGGVRVYGDATGRARHTSASRTDYQVIVDALEAAKVHDVQIKVGRSNPLQTDRANSVNGRLRSATGHIRLYILDHCKETIKDFERTAYTPGTRSIDKAVRRVGGAIEGHSHHTDAVGYKIDRDYPVRKVHVHQLSHH